MRQICVIPNGNTEGINVFSYSPYNPSPRRSAKNLRIGCQIRLVIIISLDFEQYRMTAGAVAKNKMVLKPKLGCAFVSTTSKGKLASIDKAVLVLRTEIDQQAGTGSGDDRLFGLDGEDSLPPFTAQKGNPVIVAKRIASSSLNYYYY